MIFVKNEGYVSDVALPDIGISTVSALILIDTERNTPET